MTEAERRAALEQIAAEIRGCTRCQLHRGRSQAVPGEGSPSTEVIFIGEGPGLNEDRQGRPFVGQAGSLLTELIQSIGWSREDVFITNIVKCRPPGNRDPEPSEISACAPFLERQLAVLEPALVVTLGRHSMGRFMPGARIGQAHGTVRPSDPEVGPPGAFVFAMYHPAAALHQQSLRQTLFDDMRGIPTALLEARAAREAAPEPSVGTPEYPASHTETDEAPGAAVPQTAPATVVSQTALATALAPDAETDLVSMARETPRLGGSPLDTGAADTDTETDQLTFF